MNPTNQNTLTRARSTGIFLWGSLVIFITAAILIGFFTFTNARRIVSSSGLFGPGLPIFSSSATNTPTTITETLVLTTPVPTQVGPAAVPWDGASRVTLLFMGLDYGDWASPDREGPPRTDTMLLLTVDPVAKTAGMINIPRDMWVSIPGFDYGKINTAYPLGEAYQYPGGGPGLAMKTVELFLGVPVQYYAQVDFYAFEKLIDEIGGLEINIPERITVDPIGANNTVVLQPGVQTLSGSVALGYARQRDESAGVQGGDFARGNRQMKIILAIRDKILRLNMLPTLVQKAPTMYSELANGIHTNLGLDQILSLAWLAQSIPAENIKKGVITASEVNFATSPDGAQSILKPVSSKIRMLRDEIFSSLPTLPQDNLETLLNEEQARLAVLNGSGGEGLADSTANFLKSKGANVVTVGNAQYSDLTTIIDYTGRPYTVRYLAELMNVPSSRIQLKYDPNAQVDVEVYLGADWANSNSLP